MIILAFGGAYTPPTGVVSLRLGGTTGGEIPTRELTIAGTLAPLGGRFDLRRVAQLRIAATLQPLTGSIALTYDPNVFRGPSALAGSAWQRGADADRRAAAVWRQAPRRRVSPAAAWEQAAALDADIVSIFRTPPRCDHADAPAWDDGASLNAGKGSRWRNPPRLDERRALPWDFGAREQAATASRFFYPPRMDALIRDRWQPARIVPPREVEAALGSAAWIPLAFGLPWQYARLPPLGLSVPPGGEVEPPPVLFAPDLDLVFRELLPHAPWVLRFGVRHRGIIVPIRRIYVVINSAVLTRLSDGAQIPAAALTLSIDWQSFAWNVQATLAGSAALDMVRAIDGAPVEVETVINGQTWRAKLDKWQRSRAFGSRGITVSGRSRAAYLGAPYAQARTYTEAAERTAQQLAAQELPTGWTLAWGLTDWLVPAGAWSYQDKTPIDAIAVIAAAAGGYVQAHQSDQQIIIAPRYPTAPWNWATATPDITLPTSVLTELGEDWQPITPANKIYVSGQNQGVLVGVTRAGTAGDQSLQMIVDALITDTGAARQRGTAELAAAGAQSQHTLSLPLDDGIAGLILPGILLEVTGDGDAWRGLVRGTSVSAALKERALQVSQQITVERHYQEAA